jgi:hypothetical protein
VLFPVNCLSGGFHAAGDGDKSPSHDAEHSAWQQPKVFDLAMKHCAQTSSGDRFQQISAELARLFQQQIEMTRQEALVGLTPAECAEYDKIVEGIRESYVELAKLRSGR